MNRSPSEISERLEEPATDPGAESDRDPGKSSLRRDEERLRHVEDQMEKRYRGLLEAAPDAMVVVNQGGSIVLVNVQAEKQFGYRRDELLGQQLQWGPAPRFGSNWPRSGPPRLACCRLDT